MEDAGDRRHFSLAGAFFAPPGRALTDGHIVLLLLLLSTLGVVSFATLIERASAPSIALVEPAPIAGERPVETQPLPMPPPAADPLAAPDLLAQRRLAIPVRGVAAQSLKDNYSARRGKRMHNALDIMAPRGTPVVAVDDGRVAKVYTHPLGGLSVYQYDPDTRFAYYYAHMDAFAAGLREGAAIKRGDVIGYVGTSGNATPTAPHLHFAVFRLGPDRKWWRGTAVNPFPYFVTPGTDHLTHKPGAPAVRSH